MDIRAAKAIVEAAEDLGLEVDLYEDYSGRGMYGKTTAGVTGKTSAILQAAVQAGMNIQDISLASNATKELEPDYISPEKFVREMRLAWDSMGYDSIAY